MTGIHIPGPQVCVDARGSVTLLEMDDYTRYKIGVELTNCGQFPRIFIGISPCRIFVRSTAHFLQFRRLSAQYYPYHTRMHDASIAVRFVRSVT